MEEQQRGAICAQDEMEEVAQILTFMGAAIGATPLDEYGRGGAHAVLEWAADRLRGNSKTLGALATQARNAPS